MQAGTPINNATQRAVLSFLGVSFSMLSSVANTIKTSNDLDQIWGVPMFKKSLLAITLWSLLSASGPLPLLNEGCRTAAPQRFFEEQGEDYLLGIGPRQVKVIGRKTWGAQPAILEGRSWKAYPKEQPACQWMQRITVHHTHGLYTPLSLQNFHQNIEDPKADIAYHFFITEEGRIYEGRPLGRMGSHSEADNGYNVGIALNGDFSEKLPSQLQWNALQNLILALRCPCFDAEGVWTHRERKQLNFPEDPKHWTTCPGDALQIEVKGFLKEQNLLP